MPNESGQFQDTSTTRIGKNIAIISVLGKTRIIFWPSGDSATAPMTTATLPPSLVAAPFLDQSWSIDATGTTSITNGTLAAEPSSSEATECR